MVRVSVGLAPGRGRGSLHAHLPVLRPASDALTYDYYLEQMAGLTAPGLGQILPVLFARSVLSLAASLPVLVT